jgi:hypothetical protein
LTTPKLAMPELVVGQAGKELTHNQALAVLDQLAQAVVVDKDLATPPVSPTNGAMYIVSASATGAWSGQEGKLAYWLTSVGAWTFATPVNGWSVWVSDEAARYELKAGVWTVVSTGGGGSGEANTASNLGAGAGVFSSKVGVDLRFKSLVAGSNVTITPGTNEITISASSGGGGSSLPVVQTFTGAKTLGLTDINTYNVSQDATAQVVTLPAQASVAWTADAEIHIEQGAAGAVTVTGAAGVTINGVVAASFSLSGKNAAVTLKRTGPNTWTLIGGVSASLVKADAVQVGQSSTASNNFHWRNLLDGLLRLSRGNAGSPITDVMRVKADNSVTFPGGVVDYESTEQAITTGGGITLAHTLGAAPRDVSIWAVCKTAEHGFAVGDLVKIQDYDYSGSAVYGVQSSVDSTNITLRVANGGINIMNKNTSAGSALTNANWRLIVRAWA